MPTPRGRRYTLRRKLAVGALGAALVCLFTCLPRFVVVLRDYGLCRPFAPAMSLADYAAIPAGSAFPTCWCSGCWPGWPPAFA